MDFPPNFFIEYISLQTLRTIKSYGSAASHCYQSLNFSKFFCCLCPFLFHNTLACVFFFTLLPVIKLIKDHWHGSRHISVIINETYKFNLQSSIFNKIYNFNRSIQIYKLNKNNIYCYFHDLCAKKMFEQKRLFINI
jgi:hypothetical protein